MLTTFGGLGGVSLVSQLLGTLLGITIAFAGGLIVYGALKYSFLAYGSTQKKNSTVRI